MQMFSRFFVQSQQPLIPAVFGRRFIHKIPIRNQINRQLHREGRDTIARTEENSQRQTLEKKINVQARSNGIIRMDEVIRSMFIKIQLIRY